MDPSSYHITRIYLPHSIHPICGLATISLFFSFGWERKSYPFPLNVRLPPHPAASNQDDGKEISGSDVLWALQRAAAHKKKANRKKKGSASSPEATQRLEDTIDYTNVKPLQIRTEWSLKLDELEERLHVLQQEGTT
ncbi:hypothetical protein Gotri_018166 [Gossypium trilobum]|uniref:Uncharacterized protein n=1 Tax=Gossypium trilobum TaxID=34281 RepID=A0A7J9E8S7_9ROSI|nr:hypothetical protein [Gossypium trilobum]